MKAAKIMAGVLAIVVCISVVCSAGEEKVAVQSPSVRKDVVTTATQKNLLDYLNPDGRTPDGLDNDINDTPALQKALAAGPGIVLIPAGFYRFGNVIIPEGVTFVGTGPATVLRLAKGAKRIFIQKGVNNWRLRDLELDGEAPEKDWAQRQDLGQIGLEITRCNGFEISGLVARNFSGAGIDLSSSPLNLLGISANIFNITAIGNHTGIRFNTRAEYMNAAMLTCYCNVIGCAIHAGNVKIANSDFSRNMIGMLIEDHQNGSHGTIANCLMNHNHQYALLAKDVRNGMAIDNCCFFYGNILMENCNGVSITSGIISCNVKTVGKDANRIAGNYMKMQSWKSEFSPATIVKDNYSEKGMWNGNKQP